ncbi:MAG: hypothetical protein KDA84_00630, partial [Planctomycetaceae bacterium]|nr:hypothetical protein [Planctomycetaceae bacterium]
KSPLMITPSQIKQKAKRLYPKFVNAWLAGDEFFPCRVPADLKLPKDLVDAKRAIDLLRSSAKQALGQGYSIVWESRKSRSHGLNEFPAAINIETLGDMLLLADATEEFAVLEPAVATLRSRHPALEPWLQQSTHWKDLLNVAGPLDDLMLVTQYLLDHPRPDCFAREIPLPVSTKLIEENKKLLSAWLDLLLPADQIDFRFDRDNFEARYGLRYVRHHILLRVLDVDLQKQLELPFPELSLPADFLGQLQPIKPTVFVVENKVNLLTLPRVTGGIAIGGLGKAVSLLRDVVWLKDATIYYWGDLDVEGFEMLSQFREMFEHTKSLLMDMDTLNNHRDLTIRWPNRPRFKPTRLTGPERAAYENLLCHGFRLEQERILQEDVVAAIRSLGMIAWA